MLTKFNQKDVNRIFSHIPKRTILFWVENGLVGTVGEHTDRRGRNRVYSLENLYTLATMEKLLKLGISALWLKSIAPQVERIWTAPVFKRGVVLRIEPGETRGHFISLRFEENDRLPQAKGELAIDIYLNRIAKGVDDLISRKP
ncbi:MAG: MerR family transcriptional regulator [Desulfobacca sp.]|nr:MerR family transcriptional regulator [Desulfobacca sp.]